ncbi:hypothetical protein J6590_048910 [Homalodisca vitripennis]|nr:hypothetical protein J6590_048910 [Homalodisca vitripennis]
MANPDDSDFDDFVQGALNTSFSSVAGTNHVSSDDENNVLLHNISASDVSSDEEGEPVQNAQNQTDVTKVFDCVYQPLLLIKLKVYGFSDDCANWVESYLNGCQQCVKAGNKSSDWKPVTQGSHRALSFTVEACRLWNPDDITCIEDRVGFGVGVRGSLLWGLEGVTGAADCCSHMVSRCVRVIECVFIM